MVPHTGRRGLRRLAAFPALLTAAGLLSLASACDKVPLLAPSGSVITLFPTASSVPINGSIEIVATVIENGTTATPPSSGSGTTTTTNQTGAGTPVHNGTVVSFTTTLGRIEPAEARTQNGQVRVKFIANGQSGLATITAFSGGASAKIEDLPVGSAAAERITLTTSRPLGPSGGTTDVIARVEDTSGAPLSGVPVTFSTTAGTLGATSVLTNQDGIAATTLTTNVESTVTATTGAKSSNVTVKIGARLINTFTASPTAASVGAPITFSVTPGTNLTDATVSFGDGSSADLGSIGTGSATTVAHAYTSPGSYQPSVTGRDAVGNTQTQSTTVTIGALPLTLSASPNPASPGAVVTFTVGGTGSTQVRAYRWTFSDGETRETSGPQTQKSFALRGQYTVTVTPIGLDGTPLGSASTTVTVQGL